VPRRLLAEEEVVLVDVRPHWVMLMGPCAWLLLASGVRIAVAVRFPDAPGPVGMAISALVAVAAGWVALRAARWWWSAHALTSQRIIRRSGVLGRRFAEVPLAAITEVQARRRVRDRVVGSGSLVVEMAGVGRTWTITAVRAPRALARMVERARLDHLPLGAVIVGEEWVDGRASAGGNVAARLVALDDLHRRGLVTHREYEAKREALISEL